MGATPSKIGYVRKGCARGLTKLGVSYLTVLARPSTLARLWLHVSVGYTIATLVFFLGSGQGQRWEPPRPLSSVWQSLTSKIVLEPTHDWCGALVID